MIQVSTRGLRITTGKRIARVKWWYELRYAGRKRAVFGRAYESAP